MTDYDLPRLQGAMQKARYVLKRFRSQRERMIAEYAGPHWGPEGMQERDREPLNLLAYYAQTVGRNLIAKNPRVNLQTFDSKAKPYVNAMEQWVNKQIVKTQAQKTIARIVLDALFSIGIGKVALATPQDAASVSWRLLAGMPFLERIDLDDFVFDTHARAFEEVFFIGHRFRAPLASVRDDSRTFGKGRKKLTASRDNPYNVEGDLRSSTIGRGFYGDEEYKEMVDLWEIYLPSEKVILTLADDEWQGSSAAEPLRVQKWLGPDTGPYHMLCYQLVPSNAMPKAPIQDLYDLHDAVNRLFRKLVRQAERQKSNTFVQGGADEDGNRIMKADDGDIIRVDNPEKVIQVSQEPLSQQNFVFAEKLRTLFNELGGNISLLAGAGPESPTLGQDQMLMSSASQGLQSLQNDTIDYVSELLRAKCWFWWHHPTLTMDAEYSVPGLPSMAIPTPIYPQDRNQHHFEDLQIEADPYSLQHRTPEQKIQVLDSIVANLTPIMPLLQSQGILFNVRAWLEKKAKYLNMPDLEELFSIGDPPPPEEGGGDQGGSMPSNTTRTYQRVSGTNNSPDNQQQNLVNDLQAAIPGQKNGTINRQ